MSMRFPRVFRNRKKLILPDVRFAFIMEHMIQEGAYDHAARAKAWHTGLESGGRKVIWMDRLNSCIEYIEDNLEETIDPDKLCEIALLSRIYFFKLFEAACGISLSNYIKNRRMTKAVSKLKTGMKVIDAAFLYGYASSESFSRAFKEFHGISPSDVLHSQVQFKSYPKLVFQIKIKGAAYMVYSIETKKAFTLAGKSVMVRENEENCTDMSGLWSELQNNGRVEQLAALGGDHKVYGACFPVDKEKGDFRYAVTAILHAAADVPDGLERFSVKEGRWAIFPGKGKNPDVVATLWDSILSEWLPSHDFEIDSTRPDMENYLEDGAEIWLPIL